MLELSNNFLKLLDTMSVYLLIGLFVSGILKQIMPNIYTSISPVLFAKDLKKSGVSRSNIQMFLILSPNTRVDTALVTFSFFGLLFTIFKIISIIVIALAVGGYQKYMVTSASYSIRKYVKQSYAQKPFKIKNIFAYGYGVLFKDIAQALLIGLLLGALFITFVPKEYTSFLFDKQILTYFVVLLFAMPLYIKAEVSLPIASTFVMQGMSMGSVFIFLTLGSLTSLATISFIYKELGKKSFFVYTSTILLLTFILGFIFDIFVDEINMVATRSYSNLDLLIRSISSLIVLLLIAYHLFFLKGKNKTLS